MLQKIIDFLIRPWATSNDYQEDLETYIMKRQPTTVAEVEQLTRKFTNNYYSHL